MLISNLVTVHYCTLLITNFSIPCTLQVQYCPLAATKEMRIVILRVFDWYNTMLRLVSCIVRMKLLLLPVAREISTAFLRFFCTCGSVPFLVPRGNETNLVLFLFYPKTEITIIEMVASECCV